MYQIPTTTGVLVAKDGARTPGTLPDMLKAYQALGANKTGCSIFLDDGIVMPPIYNGENRSSRRTLHATELTLFLSYLDKQAA